MNFGENLKKARTQKGLSQQELANLSGFSQVAICKFENDKIIPRQRSVAALAKALGANPDDLFGITNSTQKGA